MQVTKTGKILVATGIKTTLQKAILRSSGFRYNKSRKTWESPLSAFAARELLTKWPDVLTDSARDALIERLGHYNINIQLYNKVKEATKDGEVYPYTTPECIKSQPKKHQIVALHAAYRHNFRCGLFLEQGLGKTFTALLAFAELKALKDRDIRMLVICPSSVRYSWADEVSRHTTFSYKVVETPYKDYTNSDESITIFSYEGFVKLQSRINTSYELLIIDESQYIKNRKTKRFEYIKKFAENIPHIMLLSGLPAPEGPYNLWSQYYVMDNGETMGPRYWEYITTEMVEYGNRKLKLHPHSNLPNDYKSKAIRITKEDCLDLPEKIFIPVTIPSSKQMLDAQKTLLRDGCLVINGQVIEVEEPTAILMKQAQLSSGWIYHNDSVITISKNHKLEWVKEFLEGHDFSQEKSSILIWAQFTHDIESLVETINNTGIKAQSIYGKTKDKQKVVERFQSGKTQVLIGHPASAGTGLNLHRNCSTAIFYSPMFSYGLFSQAQDRIHRTGQDHTCTYYLLQSKDTIDNYIWKTLKNKEDVTASLLKEQSTTFFQE